MSTRYPYRASQRQYRRKMISKENTLFIVEDDREVREYLQVLLSPDYNIVVVEMEKP